MASRLSILLLALAVLAASSEAMVWGAQDPSDSLRLRDVGDDVYWAGPTIESARVPDHHACHVVGPCWEYDLVVPASRPGAALRVAATMVLADPGQVRPWADFVAKSPEMLFELQLYAPDTDTGKEPDEKGENGHDGMHGYSREVRVGGIDADGQLLPAPAVGTWRIRVIPKSVTNMALRLRAALVDEAVPPAARLLPDLRLNPPFELTLGSAPATAAPGVTATHDGPHPSCMAEEVAEAVTSGFDPPQLCLRFTMGLENVGTGALDLVWERPADEAAAASQVGGTTVRRQRQRVCNFFGSDCAYLPDRGISTLFHWGHTHEHWVDAWSIQLHRVVDAAWHPGKRPPTLDHESDARKLGINPYAELIADWKRIWPLSRPPAADNSGCFADDGGPCSGAFPIRLAAGYADLYEWNRGGNYVELPPGAQRLTPAPGWYVLTATADPLDLVAESDERNNDSFALFEVRADGTVDLYQRGYGTDPWHGRRAFSTDSP